MPIDGRDPGGGDWQKEFPQIDQILKRQLDLTFRVAVHRREIKPTCFQGGQSLLLRFTCPFQACQSPSTPLLQIFLAK